jgi:putative ABC transport system permease protein
MDGIAKIANQKVRVVAVTNMIRSFTTAPYVFTTLQRARAFIGAPADADTYELVQVSSKADVKSIQALLSDKLGSAEVITPAQFRTLSLSQWLYGTGAGAALILGTILGIIVGAVIVAQTLYSSTKDHINEFATLRAIGSSALYIHEVILCQAVLSAVIGYCIAATVGLIIAWITATAAVPVAMTPMLMLGLFVLTIAMCVFSAISAIIKVTRIDPAIVFTR